MAIETALMDIPFTGGVDEKTRAELVQPPSFLTLTNLRQRKRGCYQKRYGNVAISAAAIAGGNVPACKKLIGPFRDELVQSDGLSLYSRSATAAGWRKAQGMAPQCQTSRRPVVPTGYLADAFWVAAVNGYFVFAVLTESLIGAPGSYTNVLQLVTVDQANGAVVHVAPNVGGDLAATTQIALIACGNTAIAFFTGLNNPTNIYASGLDTTSAATITAGWGTPQPIITDAAGNVGFGGGGAFAFDACTLSTTRFCVAYSNQGGAGTRFTVTVRTFSPGLTLQATNTIAASSIGGPPPPCVGVDGRSTDVIWVGWPQNNTTTVNVIGLDPVTLATSVALATVATQLVGVPTQIGMLWTGAQTGTIVSGHYGEGLAPLNNTIAIRQFGVSASTVNPLGSAITTRGCRMETRPFQVNGRLYANFRPSTSLQSSGNNQQLLTVDLTQTIADSVSTYAFLRVVANPAPRLTLGNFAPNTLVNAAAVLSATKATFPAQVATKYGISGSIELVTLDFAATNVGQSGTFGQACAIGGGAVSTYDGIRCQEVGFFATPSITSVAVGAGVGMGIGLYNYVAVPEQWDAAGQVHQGAPSDAKPVTTTAGNQQASINTFSSCMTNRTDTTASPEQSLTTLKYVLYRTKLGGLPPYYRVPGSLSFVDPSFALWQSFLDATADNLLGAQLYTNTPAVPNSAQYRVNPPGSSCLISHQDRVVLVADDGKTIWFSGQQVYGEGLWFADLFQMTIGNAEPITALASVDGPLVVFKRRSIYYIDGQGPGDSGAGGDFSPPQQVATDVGCIEPRSLVVTPNGIVFQSLRGLELLTRARQMAPFFGNEVEASLAANPIITGAVLSEAAGEVTFYCVPVEGSATGITITWNYVFNVWNPGTLGDGTTPNVGVRSAMMVGTNAGTVPVLTWLQTNGNVFQESTSLYTDAGAWVTWTMETANIHGGGVAGYQLATSAVLQAQSLTPHDLTVSKAYDHGSAFVESVTWTAAQIAAFITPRETLQVDLSIPECTAFRLKLSDATPTGGAVGTGQGAALFGLQVELGVNGAFVPLPQENRQ